MEILFRVADAYPEVFFREPVSEFWGGVGGGRAACRSVGCGIGALLARGVPFHALEQLR